MFWNFPRVPDNQVETEITQRDQFNNDAVGLSETIVREAIQNSLDAAIAESSNVCVTFRWVDKNNGLEPRFFENLFDDQLDHAAAAGIDCTELDFSSPRALIIEDYGTKGLTGCVNEKDENNFSDFWRRHGKGHKKGKSRGRHGLGKLVYSQTSQIGVFFGVTMRAEDDALYLMGQSVLKLRELEDKIYHPHSFFSDLENENDHYAEISVPIKDGDFVQKFISNFAVERTEPGLSVIVPFPNENFSKSRMIEVSIANYFYPLITGQLKLKFDEIAINSNNVRELAKQYAAEQFHQIDLLFDFVEEVFQAEQSSLLQMKSSWNDDRKLDEDDFSEETLAEIRDKFSKGELVGLELPVELRLKDGTDVHSKFSVYVKRPDEVDRGVDLYVRGGLTLPEEAKFRDRRAFGAMIAEEEPICDFLGDAENAAHTQWNQRTEKLDKKYRNNYYTSELIASIRKSVVQLHDLLAEVSEEEDEDALQEFFWFDEPEEESKKGRRKKPKPPTIIPPIPSKPKLIQLSKVEGGFTLTGTEVLTEEMLPRTVKIKMAYAQARRNPFTVYKNAKVKDFKLGKGGIQCYTVNENVSVLSSEGNIARLQIDNLPFRFTVRGFDPNRDLLVDCGIEQE